MQAKGFIVFPGDMLQMTDRLSCEAFRAFHRLLYFIWNNSQDQCSIENDDDALALATKIADPDLLASVKAELLNKYAPLLLGEQGRLLSPYLRDRAEAVNTLSDKRRAAALQRWGSKQPANASTAQRWGSKQPANASTADANASKDRAEAVALQRWGSKQPANASTADANASKDRAIAPKNHAADLSRIDPNMPAVGIRASGVPAIKNPDDDPDRARFEDNLRKLEASAADNPPPEAKPAQRPVATSRNACKEAVSVGDVLKGIFAGSVHDCDLLDTFVQFEHPGDRQRKRRFWETRIAAIRGSPGGEGYLRDLLKEIADRADPRLCASKGYGGPVDEPAAWLNYQTGKWLEERKR